jgi:hypothetical protein
MIGSVIFGPTLRRSTQDRLVVNLMLQAAVCGGLSISFSPEIIWFEVAMLWDAKFLEHF